MSWIISALFWFCGYLWTTPAPKHPKPRRADHDSDSHAPPLTETPPMSDQIKAQFCRNVADELAPHFEAGKMGALPSLDLGTISGYVDQLLPIAQQVSGIVLGPTYGPEAVALEKIVADFLHSLATAKAA